MWKLSFGSSVQPGSKHACTWATKQGEGELLKNGNLQAATIEE